MNRQQFFADLSLSEERLDELAKTRHDVLRYFAPMGCGRAEARELVWRRREFEQHRAKEALGDLIAHIRSLAEGPAAWLRIVRFTGQRTIEQRMQREEVSFANLLEAAGIHDAASLL